ncbi:hypothetical protein L227DRAFT_568588 [Lentinus tigrinus ALCF2SS1-6]|uniref:RING-type domain-containing protein n=2 Tax=Lentinus tigrinus TaxID=5365 RepID=A0A5C2RMU4_9APHY|nr:hypothetical protein L227DRAFT_568588 [Lentinus tigrinus ALCF2SS1-6]
MHSLKIPNPEDDPDNETLERAAATSGLSETGALRYRLVLYEINNREKDRLITELQQQLQDVQGRLRENEETLAAEAEEQYAESWDNVSHMSDESCRGMEHIRDIEKEYKALQEESRREKEFLDAHIATLKDDLKRERRGGREARKKIAVLEKDKTDLEARMHAAEDKLQAINTEMTCPVCWSSPITHLWPCGHGLCRECKVLTKEAQDVTNEEEDLDIWFDCYDEQYHCPVCRRRCNQEYPLGNLHLLNKVTEILTPDV